MKKLKSEMVRNKMKDEQEKAVLHFGATVDRMVSEMFLADIVYTLLISVHESESSF